uniref:Cyclin N-terminal domain-containing protein n=1 Tax=Arcella intermedia TaxID=1963864 RepID=A0A6B2LEK4_9EUKA
MFMTNAMSAPDVDEIIICLSRALHWNIKNMEAKEPKRFKDIFSEEKYPLGDGKTDFSQSPDVEEVMDFLYTLFNAQDLSAECGVMATAYIERLIKLTGITLHASNWRRIVLGALILSSKVWEDLAVWNVDFISVFPNLKIQDLNLLEREYLCSLQFTVSLTASVYAKYYFELRKLSDRTEEFFPLKPLDQKNASLLEAKSKGLEETEKIRNLHTKRYYSLNPYEPKGSLSLEQFQASYGKKWKDDDE